MTEYGFREGGYSVAHFLPATISEIRTSFHLSLGWKQGSGQQLGSFMANMASLSASSFPCKSIWLGIHWNYLAHSLHSTVISCVQRFSGRPETLLLRENRSFPVLLQKRLLPFNHRFLESANKPTTAKWRWSWALPSGKMFTLNVLKIRYLPEC